MHVLASDPMSAELRIMLETGAAYGDALQRELESIAQPGRCPESEEGWTVDADGDTHYHPEGAAR